MILRTQFLLIIETSIFNIKIHSFNVEKFAWYNFKESDG